MAGIGIRISVRCWPLASGSIQLEKSEQLADASRRRFDVRLLLLEFRDDRRAQDLNEQLFRLSTAGDFVRSFDSCCSELSGIHPDSATSRTFVDLYLSLR